jgi:hypothetical protein
MRNSDIMLMLDVDIAHVSALYHAVDAVRDIRRHTGQWPWEWRSCIQPGALMSARAIISLAAFID